LDSVVVDVKRLVDVDLVTMTRVDVMGRTQAAGGRGPVETAGGAGFTAAVDECEAAAGGVGAGEFGAAADVDAADVVVAAVADEATDATAEVLPATAT